MQRRTKIRRRDTTEAITGAITGTLARPQLLVLGSHDQAGRKSVAIILGVNPETLRNRVRAASSSEE
ncbi:hypothetical protein [Streptomyces sp. NPDC006463]|uniref:hypothetical protein n=1 Tax=Streptomyces sp. NPDC006463 TaxID=3364746 RepID=UPI003681694F